MGMSRIRIRNNNNFYDVTLVTDRLADLGNKQFTIYQIIDSKTGDPSVDLSVENIYSGFAAKFRPGIPVFLSTLISFALQYNLELSENGTIIQALLYPYNNDGLGTGNLPIY